MGFSRQDYWSGLPFPSPGDLPGPGMEPASPALAPSHQGNPNVLWEGPSVCRPRTLEDIFKGLGHWERNLTERGIFFRAPTFLGTGECVELRCRVTPPYAPRLHPSPACLPPFPPQMMFHLSLGTAQAQRPATNFPSHLRYEIFSYLKHFLINYLSTVDEVNISFDR